MNRSLLTIAFLVLPTMASASSLKLNIHSGDADSGHAMAWTTFNGQMDNCLIDTGARATFVKSHIMSTAPSLGKIPSGGLIGTEQLADLVEVNEIKSNDWTKNNMTIRRVDKLPANCILGNDFFLQESLSIDYTHQSISTDAVFGGETFPLNHYSSMWFGFEVEYDGKTIESIFDTGAGLTLVDEALTKEHPENFEFVQKTEIRDAAESKAEASIYKMKVLKYGKWEAKNILVIAYPFTWIHKYLPTVRIVIGHNIINKHHWYLSNIEKTWSIY